MSNGSIDDALATLLPPRIKAVAPVLTIYDGLVCKGDVVERGGLFEAIRADGCSIGTFKTAQAAAAALVGQEEAACFRDD